MPIFPTIHYPISLTKSIIHSFNYYVKPKNQINYQADKTGNSVATKVAAERKDSQRNSRLYPFSTKE